MADLANVVHLSHMLPKMLDEIEDSIYIMSVDSAMVFRYHYVNRSATRFSGITLDKMGKTFFEVNSPQMANYLNKKYSKVLLDKRTIKYEDGFFLPNGMLSGESILTPIFNDEGNIEYVFSMTRDTTERIKNENMLRYYAYHDDLTKLYNRRYLLENVVSPYAVYLFDLDYFKNINDTFGHDAGDSVLTEVASRLNERFGSETVLVRLGGDEFIVAATEAVPVPERIAESINEMFVAPFEVNDRKMNLSVSIGVALRESDEDIHTLLKQADIALYKAKGEGRKRYHIYEASSKYDHVENFIHELALFNAAENQEFELHYQLIYNPKQHSFSGAEALLRWNRAHVGIVSPNEFIPIAEKSGLIIPIGYWVIRKACQDWHQLQKIYGPHFKISVNISKVQLNEEGFVDQLIRILESEGVTPQVIELEITESTVIHNVTDVQQTLGQLREKGFTISLDDFGIGYSSLSMLNMLPIDKLKIDRSFLRDMNHSFLSAILVMANALNLQTVVEGVETREQFKMLTAMNCWGLQGYWICKPVAPSKLPLLNEIEERYN